MCRLGMVGAIELTSQMEAFFNITQRNIATIMERITKFQLEGKVLTTMDLMEKKLTEERLRRRAEGAFMRNTGRSFWMIRSFLLPQMERFSGSMRFRVKRHS